MKREKQKGFTLLEILLVIVAIGILAAIVLIAINPTKQIEAARTAQRRSDLNNIAKAIQQFIIDNAGSYPGALQNIPVGATIGLCSATCSNGINLSSALSPIYIASIPVPPDANGQYTVTKTTNGVSTGYDSSGNSLANVAGSTPSLDLNFARDKSLINPTTGLPIDFTRNSIGTYTGSDGNIKRAVAGEPRFDHNPVTGQSLGLLIEEQRTNRIRNNTMVGAVAGNPGTLPTNWIGPSSVSGISRSVVGTGTENGIPYIDLRLNGTATENPSTYIGAAPESYPNLPGTNTTIYTFSSYIKLVSGTIPVGTQLLLAMHNVNSIGTHLNQYSIRAIINTELNNSLGGKLINNRYSITTISYADTNTAYHQPFYQFNIPFNTVLDITLRIGYPQVELGSFATSPIPTTATSPIPTPALADTRLPDNANIPAVYFGTIVPNTSIGSFFVQGRGGLESTQNGYGRFIGFNGGGAAISRGGLNTSIGIWDQTTSINVTNPSTNIVSNISKLAISFSGTNRNIALNGISATGTSGVDINTVFSLIALGRNGSNNNYLNGVLSRVVYFPTQLSDSRLQSLTQ